MGLFDTFLDQVTGAGGEVEGEAGGGFLDNLGGLFGGNENEGDGEGGGGFLDNLGGLFGGNENEGESGGGGGFLDNLGGLFGGNENEGESGGGLFDGLIDRVSSYLPEELQGVAGNFLGNGDAPANGATPNAPAPQQADPAPAAQVDVDDIVNTGIVPPHLNGGENDADSTMGADPLARYRTEGTPDDPTFPDNPTYSDDGIPEPAPAPVLTDELTEVAPVEIEPEPMDDFEQTIHEADQIEDSFDAMFEGLG